MPGPARENKLSAKLQSKTKNYKFGEPTQSDLKNNNN